MENINRAMKILFYDCDMSWNELNYNYFLKIRIS